MSFPHHTVMIRKVEKIRDCSFKTTGFKRRVCVSSDCDDETVHSAVRWQAKSCYDYPRGSGGGEESVGVCEVAACDWLSGRRAADCSGT